MTFVSEESPFQILSQIFQAQSEVESMKSQMKTLFNELQQAQRKLDEAEGMKKNLQDRLQPHLYSCMSHDVYIRKGTLKSLFCFFFI